MKQSLDLFDVRLLNLLQENGAATAEEMAEQVPLSASAIARRVRRLRADGVIVADVAVLAPSLVEDRLQAIIHVALHEHAQHRGLTALRDRLRGAEEVQLCFEVAGAFDLMLLTVTKGMKGFNAFADEVLAANPIVRRYETTFVKKAIKTTLAVPLDEDDAGQRGKGAD